MATESPSSNQSRPGTSFAETALVLGGKSADEARRTGAIDTADDQVEALFAPQYQTVNSPAHRAVWERGVPVELFLSTPPKTPPDVQKVMDDSVAVARRHVAGPARCSTTKADHRIGALPNLVRPAIGASWSTSNTAAQHTVQLVRAVPDADGTRRPTVAGLSSVHGCIGAVDPVQRSVTRNRSSGFSLVWRAARG